MNDSIYYFKWNVKEQKLEEFSHSWDVDQQVNWDAESPAIQSCSHKWTTYVGFYEKYDFCEHCDEKKQ